MIIYINKKYLMKSLSEFINETAGDEVKIKKEAKKLFKKLFPDDRFPRWRVEQVSTGVFIADPRNLKLNKHLDDTLNKMSKEHLVSYIKMDILNPIYISHWDKDVMDMFGKDLDEIYSKDGLYAGVQKYISTAYDDGAETPQVRRVWIWYQYE